VFVWQAKTFFFFFFFEKNMYPYQREWSLVFDV
jgi:hypothetical protein